MKVHGTAGPGFRNLYLRYSEKLRRSVKDRTRELEQAHEDLLKKNAELSTLLTVSRSLLKSMNLNDLLDKTLQGAVALVPSEAGALLLINPGTNLIELASFHNIESLQLHDFPQHPTQLHFGFDNSYVSLDDPRIDPLKRLMSISNLSGNENNFSYVNNISDGIRNFLAVLLTGMDGSLGLIYLINRIDGDFSDEEARFILAFSNEAAVAVDNFRIHSSLLEKEKEVERQRRLATLGEMSAQIAHEIRNPLQKILTGVEYLRDYCEPRDKGVVDIVSSGVSSVNQIISKMVEYGRQTSLNLQSVDIQEMIEEIVSGCRTRLNSLNISVTREFSERIKIEADIVRFKEALKIVIDNAMDAMPSGGKLKLYAGCEQAIPGIANPTARLEIKISDTGAGMDKEGIEKIFTPFYTTKVYGSGLGMAMLKKIIDLHKGEVLIKSKVGAGTEVTIRVPVKIAS